MQLLGLLLSKSIWILFYTCIFIIFFALSNRIYVLFLYKWTSRIKEPEANHFFSILPKVTIQLPIYNESTVVERLINNICAIDYPRDRLEIQVLDDSTDETKDIAYKLCAEKRAEGINITQIRRETREGYKAGALQYGLKHADGEFFAIFDSDFLPPSDFLKKTIHFFTDKKIGWVQTSWAHLNENFSLLTQCIALICDALFKVENSARSKLKHWSIFAGTAGIIRRSMIEEAGGWHWDTITEDSDLSYRALVLGWKYVTLKETTCPCELPPTLAAFAEQQIRWSKGHMQVIRKLINKILFSKVTLMNKYDFVSYLTNYLCFPAIIIFSLLIMPHVASNCTTSLESINPLKAAGGLVISTGCILFGVSVMFLFFRFSQNKNHKGNRYLLSRAFAFIFMTAGISPFITAAIFRGLFRNDKEFVRTPKYGISDTSMSSIKKNATKKVRKIAIVSILMGVYMLASIVLCFYFNIELAIKYLPEMLLFFSAYSYFGILLAFPNQIFLKNIYEKRFSHQMEHMNELSAV